MELTHDEKQQPLRLVSVIDGTASVEDQEERTTRYDISAGAFSPSRIFLRHARQPGYKAAALPEGTEESLDAYLVPQPLTESARTALTLVERRTVRRTLELRTAAESVCLYAQKTAIPPDLRTGLDTLCRSQKELFENSSAEESVRSRIDALRERAEELRENLKSIEKIAAAGALRGELLAKLRENEQKSGELQKQLITRSETRATQEARLAQLIAELHFDSAAAPPAK